MATKNVTVIFDRKGKVLKNGSGEVEIRIYLSRNQRKYIKVCTTTSKGWKFYQKSKELKEVCEKYEEIVRTMKLSGEELTIDNLNFHIDVEAVRAANEDPLKRSFTDFIKKEIEKETLRHGTYRHKIHVIETLEIFGKIKTIGDLTVANIREFDRWLHDTGDRSDVTIWDYHKRVKKYTRLLKMNEVIEKDPYEICKFSHGRSKTRTPLSEPELIALRRIRLDDKYDRVRDLFIFAAYTGLSYVDVENFDFDTMTEQIGDMFYINGVRTKTGTKYYTPILQPAMDVLRKYKFRLPIITNQKANQYLHVIESKLGIPKSLTFHLARHSFATLALSHDVPIENVAKMLGHTDIKTTQIYAKILHSTVERHSRALAASIR
jgi:site-specific recombinase XerD